MPNVEYVTKRFSKLSLSMITKANEIIESYAKQGYDLTLRQLYYQFVARDLIANQQKEYKNLGSVVNDGRLAGLIDWNSIVDRTRNVRSNSHWDQPREIVESAAEQYKVDRWQNQAHRIEVWIEKDALVGVIAGVCDGLDVAYFSCRGYTSQSEMWRAAQRLRSYERADQQPIIIHLGDHDPSGIDMTRDIQDRLNLFKSNVEVHRIALNMDQVDEHKPPPNPAKVTDSRAGGYIREYGRESWELDALDPATLEKLITEKIAGYLNTRRWGQMLAKEKRGIAILKRTAKTMKGTR